MNGALRPASIKGSVGCWTQIQWREKQIGIPVHNASQTQQPDTAVGKFVGNQAGTQSFQTVKEGSPWLVGNVGPG